MTSKSGGANRGPAPKPDRDIAGDVREKSGDASPDDRGETSDVDDCTAHDRAS